MGAIAASGQPGALEVFREVMRASASIPVAFPPVYIPVEADGQRYDEMHVDGGVTAQVFFCGCSLNIPAAIREAGLKQKPKMRIYVIRNSQFRVEYEQVQPRLLPIAGRSLTGLTASQGVGDLYRIYTFAQRDGVDFNLIAIPSDYTRIHKEEFNPEETKRLFEIAYQMGRAGIQWQKVPPGFGCLEQEQPK